MTLEEAIAEVKRATNYGPWQVGDIGGQAHNPLAHEIVRVLQAVASGDLIPASEVLHWPAHTGDKETDFDNDAVYQFARMMRTKMDNSRAKGRTGWNDPSQCSPDYLRTLLYEHIYKGDPVDVANICMMLCHYQEATTPKPSDDLRLTSDAEMAVALAYQRACEPVEANFPGTLYASNRTKAIAAILALAPAEPLAEVQALVKERDGLRDDFAKANNEFGSQTWSWPNLWKRIADLKELSNERWKRAEAAEAEVARLREALGNIARQKLHTEMDALQRAQSDYIGGYEQCIHVARAALATPEKDAP